MDWEYLFHTFEVPYYTGLVMQMMSLITIIIYLIKSGKSKQIKYLGIISIASFIQMLLTEFQMLTDPHYIKARYIDQKTMYLYLAIELACCSLYIKEHIQSRKSKILIITSSTLFGVYIVIFGLVHFWGKYLPLHIEVIEGLLIIVYCLYYFYELFALKPDKILIREPSFWAISGMLVLFSAITPLFLLFDYMRKNHIRMGYSLYSINNIAYCLLFITFIIAILLNKKKHKLANRHH